MSAALDLARTVIARGHEGTEAHALAVAFVAAERRAEVAEARWRYWKARDWQTYVECEVSLGEDGVIDETGLADKLAAAKGNVAAHAAKLRSLGVEPGVDDPPSANGVEVGT